MQWLAGNSLMSIRLDNQNLVLIVTASITRLLQSELVLGFLYKLPTKCQRVAGKSHQTFLA